MTAPHDIVGYTYRAALYCGGCIEAQLPTGPGETFDGWALARNVQLTPEDNLTEIAAAFGIDRFDERSFDSDDFPKVVFRDHLEDDERCEGCATALEAT